MRLTRKIAVTHVASPRASGSSRRSRKPHIAARAANTTRRRPPGHGALMEPPRMHARARCRGSLVQYPRVDVRLVLADRRLDLIDEHPTLPCAWATCRTAALISRLSSERMREPGLPRGEPRAPKSPDQLGGPPALHFHGTGRRVSVGVRRRRPRRARALCPRWTRRPRPSPARSPAWGSRECCLTRLLLTRSR